MAQLGTSRRLTPMSTPPPIPKNQPPPLPHIDLPRVPKSSQTVENAFPLSRLIPVSVRAWLILAILIGLAAGRARDELRSIVAKDPDVTFLDYGVLAFAVLGAATICFTLLWLIRQRSLEQLFAMKRSYWLIGMPLAWLTGVGIGLYWRYL
jgi:hypothetical protein